MGPRLGPGGTRSLQPDFRRSAVPMKVTWHAINGGEVIVVDGPLVDVRSRDQLSDGDEFFEQDALTKAFQKNTSCSFQLHFIPNPTAERRYVESSRIRPK